jgi:hypothetical protein
MPTYTHTRSKVTDLLARIADAEASLARCVMELEEADASLLAMQQTEFGPLNTEVGQLVSTIPAQGNVDIARTMQVELQRATTTDFNNLRNRIQQARSYVANLV